MFELDIFYILGNKVRRDLLSYFICIECYFSFFSNKMSVFLMVVVKYFKIMECEGILKFYEKEGLFFGLVRKYYNIDIVKIYVVIIILNIFWYCGFDFGDERSGEVEINFDFLKENFESFFEMVELFMRVIKEFEKVFEVFRVIESRRDEFMKMIKDIYFNEIGDMIQLVIFYYVFLNGRVMVDEFFDRFNLKEREVLQKVEELDRFVLLRIKDGVIEIDEERLKVKLGGEIDVGED